MQTGKTEINPKIEDFEYRTLGLRNIHESASEKTPKRKLIETEEVADADE